MKNISKIFGVGVLALAGLTGCDKQRDVFENYPVEYKLGATFTSTTIKIYSKENNESLLFKDYSNDGRIDMIDLTNLNKGSPLENFASLETGQKLLTTFLDKEQKNNAYRRGVEEGRKAR